MTQYTLQGAQANLGSIMDDFDNGLLTSVDLIKTNGGSVVAKMVKYSTYAAAAIANSADLNLVPQVQLQHGPMNPATNGLYKFTKTVDDSVAVPDGTVHASLQVTQGLGGNLWTAVVGGTAGNSYTIQYIDPGVNTATTTAALVVNAVQITLSYAAGAVTATAATVAAAAAASAAVSAVVTATTTGVPATLAAAFAATALAGGAVQPAGVQKFKAVGIFRKRVTSKSPLIAPSVTPRAVLLSKTHATFLGL